MTPKGHTNCFNLIRLMAAFQVMLVHGLNHFEISGPMVTLLKTIPGVPTFFLISGYLIGGAYQRSGPTRLKAFFRNRFLRIYPGLWVCITVATLAVFASGYLRGKGVAPLSILSWVGAQASIFQFYNPGFMRGFGSGVLNGSLWTIAVELQFYLLVPVLFWLLNRARALFGALFALSLVVNVVINIFLDWEVMAMKLVYVSFLPWVYIFMIGFAAAYYPAALKGVKSVPYWFYLAGYLLAMNLIASFKVNASNSINPVAVLFLSALVLKFGTSTLTLRGSLAHLVQKDDFSYGLYLYHMPVINVLMFAGLFTPGVNVLLTAITSVIAAVCSWYLIERPALARKAGPVAAIPT